MHAQVSFSNYIPAKYQLCPYTEQHHRPQIAQLLLNHSYPAQPYDVPVLAGLLLIVLVT